MKKVFVFVFLIFIIIILFFIDSRYIEPFLLIEKDKTLYIPNWKEDLNGLKIAVISDLHIGSKNCNLEKLENIVQKINSKRVDIIFILGDYDALRIKENYKEEDISKILNNLKSRYGVISILGNHDFKPQNVVKNCLINTKIVLLENQSLNVYPRGEKLCIVGLKDYWHYPDTNPDLIIKNIDSPIIVLSHNPDLFIKIPQKVSLTLSGHTHGGDVVFPFAGSPFIPSKYGQKYNKGYIIEHGKHLYITSGTTTTSGFRFLNPPEILYLTLYLEKSKQKDTKPHIGLNKNYQPLYNKIIKKYFKEKGR